MSLQRARELREDRARLWEGMKALHEDADGAVLDDERQASWDKMGEQVDALGNEIEAIEAREATLSETAAKIAEVQRQLEEANPTTRESAEGNDEAHKRAFGNYLARGWGELSSEDRDVLRENRALATQTKGTDGTGGYTVPVDFRAQLVEGMLAFGGMRAAANVITTADGRTLDIPCSDDTGNTASIVAEATAITASTAVPFRKVTLEAVKYYTGPIKISRELAADSAMDMNAIVRNAMTTRFARATAAHYVTRSSTETVGPHGIVNDSTGAAIAANLAAVTFDKLLTLEAAVDPSYRPNAVWMFNDTARVGFRKLREGSSGAFLWQPSLQAGDPDRLLGYPVIVNQQVASFGTSGNKPIWFGDFSHYWIRDVEDISVKVLEERYAEEDVVALLAFMRTDGRAVFGSTVPAQKPYRCILQSTG